MRGVRSLPRLPQIFLEPLPRPFLRRPARDAQLPEEVLLLRHRDHSSLNLPLPGQLDERAGRHPGQILPSWVNEPHPPTSHLPVQRTAAAPSPAGDQQPVEVARPGADRVDNTPLCRPDDLKQIHRCIVLALVEHGRVKTLKVSMSTSRNSRIPVHFSKNLNGWFNVLKPLGSRPGGVERPELLLQRLLGRLPGPLAGQRLGHLLLAEPDRGEGVHGHDRPDAAVDTLAGISVPQTRWIGSRLSTICRVSVPLRGLAFLRQTKLWKIETPPFQVSVPLRGLAFLRHLATGASGWAGAAGFRPLAGISVPQTREMHSSLHHKGSKSFRPLAGISVPQTPEKPPYFGIIQVGFRPLAGISVPQTCAPPSTRRSASRVSVPLRGLAFLRPGVRLPIRLSSALVSVPLRGLAFLRPKSASSLGNCLSEFPSPCGD